MAENNDNQLLLDTIGLELEAIVRQLAAGFDAAPAQRLRLEGLTAAALVAGIDAQTLLAFCRQRLPADADVRLTADAAALQFELWQRRAPVYPTTSD